MEVPIQFNLSSNLTKHGSRLQSKHCSSGPTPAFQHAKHSIHLARQFLQASHSFHLTRAERLKIKTHNLEILQSCLNELGDEAPEWATQSLVQVKENPSLTVEDESEMTYERTNLVRNTATKIGQVCPETRSFVTSLTKLHRKDGVSQALRRDIKLAFSCFDTLNKKGDPTTFPLLSAYKQHGAEYLVRLHYGSKKPSQAKSDARNRIVNRLDLSFFREDLAEYLIFNNIFKPIHVFCFLIEGLIREKKSKRRKSYSSTKCNIFKRFQSRCADHAKLTLMDIDKLLRPRGLTSKIITHFSTYLDSLNPKVQVLHAHAFFPGDNGFVGHFRQTWPFTTYLSLIRKQCEAFVFFSLESDSSDESGAHLYALIGEKLTKTIFSIDINNTPHHQEIRILEDFRSSIRTLDHHLSCNSPRKPWRCSDKPPLLPLHQSDRYFLCSDYTLLCVEFYVKNLCTEFPSFLNDNDYDVFRTHLSNVLPVA